MFSPFCGLQPRLLTMQPAQESLHCTLYSPRSWVDACDMLYLLWWYLDLLTIVDWSSHKLKQFLILRMKLSVLCFGYRSSIGKAAIGIRESSGDCTVNHLKLHLPILWICFFLLNPSVHAPMEDCISCGIPNVYVRIVLRLWLRRSPMVLLMWRQGRCTAHFRLWALTSANLDSFNLYKKDLYLHVEGRLVPPKSGVANWHISMVPVYNLYATALHLCVHSVTECWKVRRPLLKGLALPLSKPLQRQKNVEE